MRFLDFSLGRDFWNYRLGQIISVLGDSCSGMALAWWILDKTGSAGAMSSVLAPAAVAGLVLTPLLGPLGDNLSRKRLIFVADLVRLGLSMTLAMMAFFDFFSLPWLIGIYMVNAGCSALFNAGAGGILPQIVSREKLGTALQQTQAIQSFGGIVGGVLGGVVVATLGVFGAFAFDACSFLVAVVCTGMIRADTMPKREGSLAPRVSFTHWKNEFVAGLKVIYRVPVLLWICLAAMVMNLTISPLGIVLTVLVKEGWKMPAWFLGSLEATAAAGAIAGALSYGKARNWFPPHVFFSLSIALQGLGIALLPMAPTLILPMVIAFCVGMGISWGNIPIGTQIALTVPDAYLARVGSLMGFLCGGMAPLGIAGAGYLISVLGLNLTLILMGFGLVLLTPLILFIPLIKEFLSVEPEAAKEFMATNYPGAFE